MQLTYRPCRRGPPLGRMGAQAGFTLIELLVAIALVAVLLGLAVPSFTSVINSNRITAATNELAAGIQSARMEAIRRNTRVVLCRSEDGANCNASAGDWGGWLSFVDADADGTVDAGEALRNFNTAGGVTLLVRDSGGNNLDRFIVRADGMVRDANRNLLNAVARVCMPTTLPAENLRDLTLDAGSRVSIARGNGGGSCAAPVAAPVPTP